MAAGLGFKDFTTGEVLTAADVDGYLMQGIWVFASAAARDAAVTSPQEGNFAYLKDTNVTTYYTGSAWTNLDTTGMVNPMTTTGDTIYSSSGSTPARLGIGTAGQVLTVNSGATAPEWATPAAGGSTFSGVSLSKSTSQTLSNATDTLCTWDTEAFDTDGYHDNSVNNTRITIPSGKTGYFQLNVMLITDASSAARAVIDIRKNGSSTLLQNEDGKVTNSGNFSTINGIIYLTAGDYIEIRLWQNSGTNMVIAANSPLYPHCSLNYLGA